MQFNEYEDDMIQLTTMYVSLLYNGILNSQKDFEVD